MTSVTIFLIFSSIRSRRSMVSFFRSRQATVSGGRTFFTIARAIRTVPKFALKKLSCVGPRFFRGFAVDFFLAVNLFFAIKFPTVPS